MASLQLKISDQLSTKLDSYYSVERSEWIWNTFWSTLNMDKQTSGSKQDDSTLKSARAIASNLNVNVGESGSAPAIDSRREHDSQLAADMGNVKDASNRASGTNVAKVLPRRHGADGNPIPYANYMEGRSIEFSLLKVKTQT